MKQRWSAGRIGALLGFAWGLTESAFNGLLGPLSYSLVLSEIVLNVLLWSVLAALLGAVLSRTGLASHGSFSWLLSGLFVTAYVNYVLQCFLIEGIDFFTPRGLLIFGGVALCLMVVPAIWAVRSRREVRRLHGGGYWFVLALFTGLVFAWGREGVSRLDPGMHRTGLVLGVMVLLQVILGMVYGTARAPFWKRVFRLAAPLVLLVLLAKPLLLPDRGGALVATAPPRMPPVILISLDTTRQDHLSFFGYGRETSPAIDAFLRESRVYPRSYSTSSWTLPSHASVFTGAYPKEHGAHFPAGSPRGTPPGFMSAALPTVAEAMKERGYLTAAIASNPIAIAPELGLSRGFDHVDSKFIPARRPVPLTLIHALRRASQPLLVRLLDDLRPASEITRLAREWVEPRQDRPFLLFLNYYDPHMPYSPARPFTAREEPFSLKAWYHRVSHENQTWEQRIDLYDGEIRFMDEHVGRLFSYLKDTGLYDRSLIILFSDHGEFFGERGRLRGHGKNLDEAVHKIVFGVRYPGGAFSGIDSTLVNLTDARSFVDAYLDQQKLPDFDAPDGPRVSGEKYLRASDGRRKKWEGGSRLISVHWRDMKYVHYQMGGKLYDLVLDPLELNDLSGTHPDADSFLFNLVEQWDGGLTVPEVIEDPRASRRAQEVLKNLGYMN